MVLHDNYKKRNSIPSRSYRQIATRDQGIVNPDHDALVAPLVAEHHVLLTHSCGLQLLATQSQKGSLGKLPGLRAHSTLRHSFKRWQDRRVLP